MFLDKLPFSFGETVVDFFIELPECRSYIADQFNLGVIPVVNFGLIKINMDNPFFAVRIPKVR